MRVRVLFFGVLQDLLPGQPSELDLPAGSTVATLLDHFRAAAPSPPLWSSLAVAVNQQYASAAHPLTDGDEVALLPPVSGGAEQRSQVVLTHDFIYAEPFVAALKRTPDGALVIFDGVVRDNTRGRRTRYLVYEAYESMALAKMRALATDVVQRFPVRDVAIAHRLGKLQIGDTSVVIAVASAHRAAAFDACRYAIDTLKKTVPIWKKEHFEDGAVWADGEPFPPELRGEAAE